MQGRGGFRKMNKSVLGWLGACGAILIFSGTADAGELLRLKSAGTIRMSDRSADLMRLHAFDQSYVHFVVQFNSAITEQDKQMLRAQGMEIERYIPDDALLVRGTSSAAGLVKLSSERVRAVSRLVPEWKISPEFWTEPSTVSAQAEELILISTLSDSSAQDTARELERIPGVAIRAVHERDLVISASKARLHDIAAIDAIEWVERAPVIVSFVLPMDGVRTSGVHAENSPVTGYESGTKLMGFEAAWSRGFKGGGQIAVVADTGLDSGDASTLHSDFKDPFLKGYLSGLGTETWGDSMGHGTHVCGSVVGTGRASDGAFKGGAHEGKLIIEGLWSALLDNLAPSTNFNALLDPVYADGARVHSNSWGNARNFGDYDTFAARVDEYMWNHPEMLVLFAAGNSGVDANHDGRIDEGSVGSPGTAKNVLTVGASKNYLMTGGIQKPMHELRDGEKNWGAEPIASSHLSDNPQGLAAFSSRGPTSDGRIKPEIVAPGTNIVSTRSHNPKSSALWGAYNADYAYAGGTSMATPLTAGAATVLREYLIKARGISQPSAALVKGTLMHTATDLFPGQFGVGQGQELPTRRPNVHEGYGRVNMDAATALGDDTQLIDDKAGVGLSEEKAIQVTVGASGTLRATLTYTDAPASTSASRALVNDLDLKITAPDGKVYQKQDRINNAEMIELTGLAPGSYTVSVLGINVPQGRDGKQPYSLVVSRH
jgi:serine protease AprX